MDQTLSALVVLRPRGEFAPDPERYFNEQGFEVTPRIALSLSIIGPQSLFEKVFGAPLLVEGEGTTTTARTQTGGFELPLESLPPEVADEVEAITFTPPPAFGPTDFA